MIDNIKVGDIYFLAGDRTPVKILYVADTKNGDQFDSAMDFPVVGVLPNGQVCYWAEGGVAPSVGSVGWDKNQWNLVTTPAPPEAA